MRLHRWIFEGVGDQVRLIERSKMAYMEVSGVPCHLNGMS